MTNDNLMPPSKSDIVFIPHGIKNPKNNSNLLQENIFNCLLLDLLESIKDPIDKSGYKSHYGNLSGR